MQNTDWLIAIARDLPSTAVLILFVWVVNRQFTAAIDLLRQHLADVSKLLDRCIGQSDTTPRN